MKNKPFHLDPSIARCLAHDEDGRPNGCARSDACARHVALRHPHGETGHVHYTNRACRVGGFDKFIGFADSEGGDE